LISGYKHYISGTAELSLRSSCVRTTDSSQVLVTFVPCTSTNVHERITHCICESFFNPIYTCSECRAQYKCVVRKWFVLTRHFLSCLKSAHNLVGPYQAITVCALTNTQQRPKQTHIHRTWFKGFFIIIIFCFKLLKWGLVSFKIKTILS